MAALSVGMFPVDVSMAEDRPGLGSMPKNTLPAPQLVMLANVAAECCGGGDGSVADEKEMVELKTVGCSYSDSEDESVIRYSYNDQNHLNVCAVDYPESPNNQAVAGGDHQEKEVNEAPSQSQPHPSTPNPPKDGASHKGTPPTVDGLTKKKPFCCKPCRFQAQNKQQFMEHLSSHLVSKMLVVNQVEGRSKIKAKEVETPEATPDKSSEEAENGGEGASTGNEKKGLFKCERCGYNTNRLDHYMAHLKHHSKEGEDHRVFKCTLCTYTTVSQYHWRKHLRNHFPSKLHTCSQCSYFSDRKSNYIQHIRTHTGVRPFQCAYCDYSSSQKTHLTRHMRTHSGERPFKCESCPYLAANQHEVTRHARQVHNGPKPLSCPYCEYKTADRSNFKKHVELHLNPRQFLCPLCKYAASKKCNLQYHIKSRHSGCSVELDVSKVKLRIKKPSTDTADENSKGSKSDDSSSLEEDMEEEDDHASPINLSIKKSSKTNLPETTDKSAKKPGLSSEEEKPQKVKEQEKKISTRQKKVLEGPGETTSVTDNKVKKRVKKLQAEKKRVQDQAEEPPPEKHRPGETCLQQTSQEALVKDQKVRPDKEKEPQSSKPRKCGSRKSEKKTQQVKEAPEKAMIPAKKPKPKVVKDKPTKRRAAEALDLSQKSSKTRRLKPPAAEKLPAKSSQQVESSPAVRSSRTASAKTRKSSKKASELQQTVAPSENPTPDRVPSSEAPETSSQPTGDRPAGSSKERTDSGEPAASPTEDRHPPTFIKPTLPPLLPGGQRSRPADAEDDEGIHSCQEAGSDISDSASEGSDDSGLNGTGARLSKMANDPETPTEEVPTPAGLKSHLCIFCDRTFMQEGEYRRHLNRHLVNVYYMDGASSTQK
ncbi:RE1-silencing transcription factor [Oryzias melastigma]|nr:RE1-silencing transcription factor [Oryzias melastigma]XP_024138989.1 RE1-silencing transcription factor [Oryzias melastigma]